MQALCHHDVQGGEMALLPDALAGGRSLDPRSLDYARALCEHYKRAGDDIDDRLRAVLRNWSLERVDSVARNVARVATIELVRGEVPPKVAVNEAVEIAREYGSDESARFVNGLLDPIMDSTRKDA